MTVVDVEPRSVGSNGGVAAVVVLTKRINFRNPASFHAGQDGAEFLVRPCLGRQVVVFFTLGVEFRMLSRIVETSAGSGEPPPRDGGTCRIGNVVRHRHPRCFRFLQSPSAPQALSQDFRLLRGLSFRIPRLRSGTGGEIAQGIFSFYRHDAFHAQHMFPPSRGPPRRSQSS